LRELPLFILEGWLCPDICKTLKDDYNALIKLAAKDIEKVYLSFNVPEHALKIPIAKDYVKYNSYANYGEVVNAKL
jgi:hypothetical protein